MGQQRGERGRLDGSPPLSPHPHTHKTKKKNEKFQVPRRSPSWPSTASRRSPTTRRRMSPRRRFPREESSLFLLFFFFSSFCFSSRFCVFCFSFRLCTFLSHAFPRSLFSLSPLAKKKNLFTATQSSSGAPTLTPRPSTPPSAPRWESARQSAAAASTSCL